VRKLFALPGNVGAVLIVAAGLKTLPIGEFEPMLRRVFAQPRHSLYKAAIAVAIPV